MKQPTNFHELIGFDLGTKEVSWSERDAILYALACGAGAHELDLVYERDLRVLPGFVAALGLWAVEKCGDIGIYDRKKSLHVSQGIMMHAQMPRQASLQTTSRVVAVWDKSKATIVDIEVCSSVFTVTYSIFLPGVGGWGGTASPPPSPSRQAPVLNPIAQYQTSPEQAVLYRLTGDLHPVHVDTEVAKGYGFDRPILHGLCTLGIALRMLGSATGHHPYDLLEATARLSMPVLPGDLLTLRVATSDGGVAFDMMVQEKQVLKEGWAKFGKESKNG